MVDCSSETNPPVLKVGFVGGRVSQPLVSHLIALPPGTYRYPPDASSLIRWRMSGGCGGEFPSLRNPMVHWPRRRRFSATRPGAPSP